MSVSAVYNVKKIEYEKIIYFRFKNLLCLQFEQNVFPTHDYNELKYIDIKLKQIFWLFN